MNCRACGHASPDRAKFCLECGAPLATRCAGCGSELPTAAKFCAECGARVAGAAPGQGEASAALRSPRDYTPKHLADKILQSRSALEGERKQVTVLFADVKSSMELAEQLGPEEWHRILERFFEILTEGVHRFEGTVNQYTGDGIMALFGAPIAHEDHAQRACYTALALREEIARYAIEVKREHGLGFSTRMGIHSGDVVVGKIGDDLRMDYTAQGHTVGLAQRMESLAEPNTCYLSEAAASLVKGYFALEDLGAFVVKGANAPLHVFELKGLGPAQTRFDRSRARGLSKFVGRAPEMATLANAMERTLAGHGQVVGVVADAGTGKSRLAFEFTQACRARGITVRAAHGVAHGKAVPLLPVLEFYRDIFGIESHDDDAQARRKIAGSVVALDETLVSSLPLLYEFLNVPDPQKPLRMAPGPEREQQLLALLKRLMLERSKRAPAVLLFEDLHWVDSATSVFLENLVDATGSSRTLMLVNFRPEFRAEWTGRSYYQQITLAPLDATAFREMFAEVLGDDASVRGLPERIHERSAGNPFFAEEIVQELIESGALEGARGQYRLTASLDTLAVPATVQAVLAARIDRLPEQHKRVLQTAAVIGRDFSRALLARVAEVPDADLDASLRGLVQAEFLIETALYPEAEYTFKHPLTQEVALGSQLRERRARVHAAVAEALTELHAGSLDEHAALLAQHWESAGRALEAARWHARVALRAQYGLDTQAALERWRHVDALLAPLPEDQETLALRATAMSRILPSAVLALNQTTETEALFERGIDLARRAGNRRAEAMLHSGRAMALYFNGARSAVFRALREPAVAIAEADGDVALLLNVSGIDPADDMREALAGTDRLIALAGDDPGLGADLSGFSPLLRLLSLIRPNILVALGRLREADETLTHAGQILAVYSDLLSERFIRMGRSKLALSRGDIPEAVSMATRAVELASEVKSEFNKANTLLSLFAAHAAAEDWDRAEVTLAESSGIGFRLRPTPAIAALHLARGRVAQAIAAAAECIENGEALPRTQAHLLRAHIRLRSEGADAQAAVESDQSAALSLIETLGVELVRPALHESRADLARVLGDEAAAQRELREAHRLYVEMGATGHVARLARQLGP